MSQAHDVRSVVTTMEERQRIVELKNLITLMNHRLGYCEDDEEYRVLDSRLQKWREELRGLEAKHHT